MFVYFFLPLFLSSTAFSQVINTSQSTSARICYDVTIPVTVTSSNYIWGLNKFSNNYDVGNFLTELNRRDAATSFVPFSGVSSPETNNYSISGTFCTPKSGKVGTVMVASHGLLMDR